MQKIYCKSDNEKAEKIRVKILKAPFVDSNILKRVVRERARAIVI